MLSLKCKNSVVVAYGSSGAGKTYTIQVRLRSSTHWLLGIMVFLNNADVASHNSMLKRVHFLVCSRCIDAVLCVVQGFAQLIM